MNYYLTRFQKGLVAVALSFGLVANNSYSTGIPVVDVLDIAQTTTTAMESIEQTAQMIQSYETQIKQYEQEIIMYENMSGTSGMGSLLDEVSDTATRRWAPASWQDTLAIMKAGGIPGSNMSVNTAIVNLRNQLNAVMSDQIFKATGGRMARQSTYYDTAVSTAIAAMGLSDNVFSTSNQRTDNIQQLASHIDTATSMKESMDLNNRLLVQMLHQQNQMIQVMAMQTESLSTQNYGYANGRAASAEFNTFTPGF